MALQGSFHICKAASLQCRFLFRFFFRRLIPRDACTLDGTGPEGWGSIGHAHHLAGNAIGFLFVLVIGSAHGKFGLDAVYLDPAIHDPAFGGEALRLDQLCNPPIAKGALQMKDEGISRPYLNRSEAAG
jgi:hypothetical protein